MVSQLLTEFMEKRKTASRAVSAQRLVATGSSSDNQSMPSQQGMRKHSDPLRM